ncbi:signal peptidase I [bacterium]|nr:signal peptidase I [bacterium]
MEQQKKDKIKKEIIEWAKTIVIAFVLALTIRTFVVQAFKIPSGSMMDTLFAGDYLFVNKFIYGTKVPFTNKKILVFRKPKRGDIIVFKYPVDPKRNFIKRCIGLPGDTIEIRNKKVYINGEVLKEGYVVFKDQELYPNVDYLPKEYSQRDNFGPVVVPDNACFMMGDNRDSSYDSRFWGFLPDKNIKGKALIVYFPPKRMGLIK